jgi:methionine-rich copper-binding protein CopC
MRIGKRLAASILCLAAATAHAHAHLTDSDPREGSTGKAPAQIVLTFSEAARLTTITLGKDGTEAHKLAPPTVMGVRLTVPLPALAAGRYTLSWRVVGTDGHVTSGALHFSVLESTAPGGGAPQRRV